MHLGLCLDPRRSWRDQEALARQVDEAGWQTLYVCDHFYPADSAPTDAVAVSEAWTTLSAIAVVTTGVRLGTLVLGAAFRHPAVVANMAATLDRRCDGRLVLGMGAGWQPNEHAAYGLELLDPTRRLDRFAEFCEVIDGLLHAPPVTFHGQYYSVTDARCGSRPVQPRVPLLVGGGGEQRTLRIAARFADLWHHWATPESFNAKSRVLDRRCGEIGRDPAEVGRLTGQVVHVTSGSEVPDWLDPNEDVVGPVDVVADQLSVYANAGVDEFIVRDHSALSLESMQATVAALTEGSPRH
jgi:alkanesulfonate monooxygenase SsuD/methylene tetrahydromethanopterin reductase-like flavin-dependent oxidoreductase (luciferase family)